MRESHDTGAGHRPGDVDDDLAGGSGSRIVVLLVRWAPGRLGHRPPSAVGPDVGVDPSTDPAVVLAAIGRRCSIGAGRRSNTTSATIATIATARSAPRQGRRGRRWSAAGASRSLWRPVLRVPASSLAASCASTSRRSVTRTERARRSHVSPRGPGCWSVRARRSSTSAARDEGSVLTALPDGPRRWAARGSGKPPKTTRPAGVPGGVRTGPRDPVEPVGRSHLLRDQNDSAVSTAGPQHNRVLRRAGRSAGGASRPWPGPPPPPARAGRRTPDGHRRRP